MKKRNMKRGKRKTGKMMMKKTTWISVRSITRLPLLLVAPAAIALIDEYPIVR